MKRASVVKDPLGLAETTAKSTRLRVLAPWALLAPAAAAAAGLSGLGLLGFAFSDYDREAAPATAAYYALPAILVIVAWEALRFQRGPALALAVWANWEWVLRVVGPDAQSAIHLAWSLPLVAGLAWKLYARPAEGPARAWREGRAAGAPA